MDADGFEFFDLVRSRSVKFVDGRAEFSVENPVLGGFKVNILPCRDLFEFVNFSFDRFDYQAFLPRRQCYPRCSYGASRLQ